MPISFSRPIRPATSRARRRRDRGARADQYRQDASRDRAHAGAFERHDRAAAAAARARGLQQVRRARRGRAGRARHRRGEDQAARTRASGSRRIEAMPRDLDVAFVAIDEIQLGADLERGHVFTDRMLNRRGRDETLVLGAATMRSMVEKLLPGANILSPPAALDVAFRGREEAHAPAAPLRDRRVLGRRSLRDRRTDPPPARRRRRRARLALAAHAQRAGRALSVGRCRLSGRDRCDRHGPQSRRRSRGVRGRPQVRRLSVPQAQSRRARPDRRPRRPRDARRDVRHHRPLPAVRARTRAGAGEPHLRFREGAAMAQQCARLRLARRACGFARADADRTGPHARADRRRYPSAGACFARRRGARFGHIARRDRAAVGGLPGSGLSQDLARRPCRDGRRPSMVS